MWIEREIGPLIQRLAATRPAVLVTGPRQTGKSSLLRRLFPHAHYVVLDRPRDAEMAEQNPSWVLDVDATQVVLDEVQHAPGLFSELKVRIDANRQQHGRWILTGSQLFPLMRGVTESLAGRIGLVHLTTLSAMELRDIKGPTNSYLWRGGYPELWSTPDMMEGRFFDDYIATYLERDLRPIVGVQDLRTFDRFLRAVAARSAQLINYDGLATDVGISAVTAKKWLSALQASGLVTVVEPFFNNLTKRLIKTPKVFFNDHGLLCHLVGARSERAWHASPMSGALWETLVWGQILRWAYLQGWLRNLFFWRDKSSREVDFMIDMGDRIVLIECKSAEQPPRILRNLDQVELELCRSGPTAPKVLKTVACRTETLVRCNGVIHFNPLLHGLEAVFG